MKPRKPSLPLGKTTKKNMESTGKSPIRKTLKIVLIAVFAFVLLIIIAGGSLVYFLTSDSLRPFSEQQLSSLLQMPVRIGDMKVDLARGIRIKKISLGKDRPLFKLNAFILEYDLSRLPQGELVIHQLVLDRPEVFLESVDGNWNFQPLLDLAGPPPPEPEEKKPFEVPSLPVGIHLVHFGVDNFRADLNIDGETQGRLEGLSLEAKAKAGREEFDLLFRVILDPPADGETEHNIAFSSQKEPGVDVKTRARFNLEMTTLDLNRIRFSGKMDLATKMIRAGKPLPSPDLAGDFEMEADLHEQSLKIPQILLTLGKENRIELSGEARSFMSNPEFNILLKEASFNIGRLATWAKDFIPPIEATGVLKVSDLKVSGRLPEFKPETLEVQGGKIFLNNLNVAYPSLSAKISGAEALVNLNKIQLENGIPQNLDITLRAHLKEGKINDLSLTGLNQELLVTGEGANLLKTKLRFDTSLKSAAYSHPELGVLKTGLRVNGTADFNLPAGDIDSLNFSYAVGSMAKGKLNGEIKEFGKKSILLTHELELKLDKVLAFIPKTLLKKLEGLQLAGGAEFTTQLEGQLDSRFQPIQIHMDNHLELKKINGGLKNPALKLNNLAGSVSFPVDFQPAKGIKIPTLDLQTTMKKIQALNKWDVGPVTIQTRLTMGKFFNPANPSVLLPVTNRFKLKVDQVRSSQPDLLIAGLNLDASLKGDFQPGDFRDVTLKGNISLDKTEAVKKITTGKMRTDFQVDIKDQSLTSTQASVKGEVNSLLFKDKDLNIKPGSVLFESSTRQNLKSGNIQIDYLRVRSPSLLQFDTKGQLEQWGKTFAIESKASQIQLAALWELVPEALRSTMESLKISGTAGMTLSAKGNLPEKFSAEQPDLPIDALANFNLNDLSVSWPEHGLQMEEMNTAIRLEIKKGFAEISGSVATPKLLLTEALGDTELDPAFNFRYTLEGLNKFSVDKHELTLKNFGIAHTLSGRVDGLKAFLTGKVPIDPAELTRRLDISLVQESKIQIEKVIALAKNMKANGAIHTRQELSMIAGREIELDGQVQFNSFNLELPGTAKVVNINGRFPFNKKLLLDKSLLRPDRNQPFVSQRSFFNQLRDFSRYKNILQIDSVEVKKIKASNIGLDIFFKNNRFMLERFLFDILDGSVAGNLSVVNTPKGPAMHFSTEFAGLDFEELIPKRALKGKSSAPAQSEVDGHIEVEFQIEPGSESETISIDQIGVKIAVTRIGAETLDRVLLFLDPGESKPAIADIRSKLKLASPHRILISMANGNLNLEAWLKNKVLGNIIKAPELKRIPISSLKRFSIISEPLQALAGLGDLLKYFAARGIEFNEEKKIAFY